MKTQYLFLIYFFLISCEKKDSLESQILNTDIIGNWTEISPCEDCNTLTFFRNDTIHWKNHLDPNIYKMFYRFKSKDSIEVTRLWEIEERKKTSTHKINISSDNILSLELFMPVDYGITGFEDITLDKSN